MVHYFVIEIVITLFWSKLKEYKGNELQTNSDFPVQNVLIGLAPSVKNH